MGATDKFQGTGVYSGVKMEREPKDSSSTSAAASAKGEKQTKEASKKR